MIQTGKQDKNTSIHLIFFLKFSVLFLLFKKNKKNVDSDDSDFDAAEETRKLEQLKKQKLWDQLVHAVTKSIKRNKNDINLSRMNITKLPNVRKRGHELFAEVNLSENKIKKIEITSPLLTLSNLLHLFLMDNSLLSLPNMTSLSSLVLLDVDGNDLGRGKLKNMYKFNCLREFSQKKLKKTSHYFVYSHRDIR
jgi:hypothetical protein